MKPAETLAERRKRRIRFSIQQKAKGRPRLSVFRSSKHIYAQVIDDTSGKTLASASTVDKELRADLKKSANLDAARKVGALIATRAKAAKIEKVVFDRGSYLFHGRVKALADAAREAGLSF